MSTLREKWEKLKAEQPGLRIRNAAQLLGVSELELLLSKEEGVKMLRPEVHAILKEIESLGRVMALTRNQSVVHERKGVYLNAELDQPAVGLFVGEDIDLRLFFTFWKYVVAVEEGQGRQVRKSIQFFAKDGEAIHKIYLTPQSDESAYQALVEKYVTGDTAVNTETIDFRDHYEPLSEESAMAFKKEWLAMTDPHQFFGLLKKYKVSRTDALRAAPEGGYATRVDNGVLKSCLGICADKELPIMVFAGNRHAIQIHTGPVHSIVEVEGWLNVLDPDFNLHVRSEDVAETWIVRKPTEGSVVTSLECYDRNGDQIVQLFGKRKPGIPEREDWREVIASLETAEAIH